MRLEKGPDGDERAQYLSRLYELLEVLGQKRTKCRLRDCDGRMDWPNRGLYFFFDEQEPRRGSGTGPRVVRVGTHALTKTSRTSLWNRLSQHRGQQRSGGGNHRGSVFRKLVGQAIIARERLDCDTWGQGNNAPRPVRDAEHHIEILVSQYIGDLPFLWLGIEDEPGPDSMRGYLERNTIALLSNHAKSALDPPSLGWLGRHSNRPLVRESGLWNQNHTRDTFDPGFLDRFSLVIDQQ